MQIFTNDKDNLVIELIAKALAKPLFKYFPSNDVFFKTRKGISQTRVVSIVNDTGKKIKILDIQKIVLKSNLDKAKEQNVNFLDNIDVQFIPFSKDKWHELIKSELDNHPDVERFEPDKADYLVTFTYTPGVTWEKPVTGQITLVTNLENLNQLNFYIRYEIETPISIYPASFMSLNDIPLHITGPIVREFTIRHFKNKGFKIKKIHCSEPYFKFNSILIEDHSYVLKVIYMGGFPPGRNDGTIWVETDDIEQPKLNLHYSVMIKEPLRIEPPDFIDMTVVSGSLEDPITHEFSLRSDPDIDFNIVNISCDKPYFQFDQVRNSDKSFRIIVSYKGGCPKGFHEGNIIIHTDLAKQSNLIIRYRIRCYF